MSSQQQQYSQREQTQREQTQQQQSRQLQPSVKKQSGKYTTDKPIIDEIAKLKVNKTMSREEKNKEVEKQKFKMIKSLIDDKVNDPEKYIKTVTQDGKTSYYLNLSGRKDTPTNAAVETFNTMSDAKEALIDIIVAHASKVTDETFDRCNDELDKNPEYLTKFKLQPKKEEIDKREAELKLLQTKLLSQKQRIDKQIIDSTAELQSKINLYNSSTQRTFDAAKMELKMTQSDLTTARKNQNDRNLVIAQQATTDAIKKTAELMNQTMRESHDMTIAANAENSKAITSAIVISAEDAKKAAEDAKKAAENAANDMNSNLGKLSEASKKAAADAMTAAEEANKLSTAQLAKQQEMNAAVNAMNKAVVAASDRAERGVAMLGNKIEEIGSELRDIKELLGNKLDTLAEAFKRDEPVEITPDILNGIFDNFLDCSAGYKWMMKKNNHMYGHTDSITLNQLQQFYHRKYNYDQIYASRDYLQCAGPYNNGNGMHTLSLYDFNTMLIMNNLPQIDWSDPDGRLGIHSKFGDVASEPYKV